MKKMSAFIRYGILGLSLCALIDLLTTRIIEIRFKTDMCPIASDRVDISADEANFFFKHWADYINRGYNKKVPEDLRYDDQKISKRLPWVVKLWFDKRCISAERFYYVEQRMRNILKTRQLKNQTNDVIGILKSEISEGVSSEKAKWYNDIIEEQHQMANIEGITDDELRLIEGYEEEIRKVLQ